MKLKLIKRAKTIFLRFKYAENQTISLPSSISEKVVIYSLYIGENRIFPQYIVANSIAFEKVGFQSIFVVTHHDSLNSREIIDQISKLVSNCGLIIRSNYGKDFGSFKVALELLTTHSAKLESIILQNDSLIGPLYESDFFSKFIESSGDLVGLTESFDRSYHLQSSLLLVKGAPAIRALKDFFKKYPMENDRELIIAKGEVGLTQYFLSLGLRVNCYANLIDLIGLATDTKKIKGLSSINSQHLFMEELFINMNIPFLKREALSQNPTHSNYDYSAIFQRMTISQRELLMNALRFRV